MAKASISKAWDEARAILARDGSVLATIALALIVLPGLLADLFMPGISAKPLNPGPSLIVVVVLFAIGLVGQLAVIRIAVGNGGTVAAAIQHAARRTLPYVAACMVWGIPLALMMLIISRNADQTNPPDPSTAALVLVTAIALLVGLVAVVPRMLLSAAIACNENVGPLQIVRRSWTLSRGNWLRLLGFFLLFVILLLVVMAAVAAIVGTVAAIIFGKLEPWSIGAFIVSLVSQLAGAVLSVLFSLMIARIYLQLAGPDQASRSVPSSVD
ncbi:MAG: hypothetical protein ACJ8EY_01755 [Sphingomicrobium sp.]